MIRENARAPEPETRGGDAPDFGQMTPPGEALPDGMPEAGQPWPFAHDWIMHSRTAGR